MLCKPCAGIFEGSIRFGATLAHHANAQDLRQSVNSGCRMCAAIEQQLSKRSGSAWDTHRFSLSYTLHPHATRPLPGVPATLWFTCPSIDAEEDGWGIWFKLGEPDSKDFEDFLVSEVHMQTDTALSVDLALNWLDNCVAHHPGCVVPNPERFVPTRLVDVHASPPCLRTTPQIPPGSAYTTLSHRWRTPPCLILTRADLADFEKALPMERLSTVFLDAINITKRCGVQYLWIDSLCILQDSKEDWARESALMGEVYKHGRCNFATSADAEGGDGFFVQRLPSRFRPGYVRTQWDHLRNGTYIWVMEEHLWYPPSMAENTFQSRGWILQEGYLSPRTIHFTNTEIQWECRLGLATETWPCHIPNLVVAASITRESFSFKSKSNQHGSEAEILWRWMALVNRYTGCLLTRESDRLIAFSAIAREFSTVLGDTYLAGLWKRNFVAQLDWAVPRLERKETPPDVYIAPSWSWAAVGTLAQFPFRSETRDNNLLETMELIDVVDVMVTSEFDEFGAVRDGHLVVRGLVSRLARVEVTDAGEGPTYFQLRQLPTLLAAPEPIAADVASLEPTFVSMVEYDMLTPPPADQVVYLPTLVIKEPGESRIVGMVLQPEPGRMNVFKRVGRFDFLVEFWDKESSAGSDVDMEPDDVDTDDAEPSDGSQTGDAKDRLHLFWEWDMLARAFLGDEQPLFELDPATQEYNRAQFDRHADIVII